MSFEVDKLYSRDWATTWLLKQQMLWLPVLEALPNHQELCLATQAEKFNSYTCCIVLRICFTKMFLIKETISKKVCYLPKTSAVTLIVFLNFYRKFSGSPVFGRHDGSFLRYQSILAHLLDEISLYKVYLLLWVYNAPSPSNIWRRNDQWFFRKV